MIERFGLKNWIVGMDEVMIWYIFSRAIYERFDEMINS